MSTVAEGKPNDEPSENNVLPQMAEKKYADDDSDSSPPDRPTSLFVGSKYDTISVDESLENKRYFCYKRIKAVLCDKFILVTVYSWSFIAFYFQ